MSVLPLLFAIVIGFNHAFEADHVLAIGPIANKRPRLWLALRDGLFWGLGHTSTIILVGAVIILGKLSFEIESFAYFEVLVGVMMIVLGAYRLYRLSKNKLVRHSTDHADKHHVAYSVGLLHGLAGSGAVVLIAMSELESSSQSIIYLLLFGLGSILGMTLVAGLFSLPIHQKFKVTNTYQYAFVALSSVLCIAYGGYMIWQFIP